MHPYLPIANILSTLASEIPFTVSRSFLGVNAIDSTVLYPALANFSQSLAEIPCSYRIY